VEAPLLSYPCHIPPTHMPASRLRLTPVQRLRACSSVGKGTEVAFAEKIDKLFFPALFCTPQLIKRATHRLLVEGEPEILGTLHSAPATAHPINNASYSLGRIVTSQQGRHLHRQIPAIGAFLPDQAI